MLMCIKVYFTSNQYSCTVRARGAKFTLEHTSSDQDIRQDPYVHHTKNPMHDQSSFRSSRGQAVEKMPTSESDRTPKRVLLRFSRNYGVLRTHLFYLIQPQIGPDTYCLLSIVKFPFSISFLFPLTDSSAKSMIFSVTKASP